MKKLLVKCCVVLALSASMVLGGASMVQAAHVDVACEYGIGFMPLDFPDKPYDCKL